MLLNYNELLKLIKRGTINAPTSQLNGTSIDITLGDTIFFEESPHKTKRVIDLKKKENVKMREVALNPSCLIKPGQFLLASSVETFNLPGDISCEYKLKSSLARNGLQHALAGWCDPYWTGSVLTLELTNTLKHHDLLLTKGMKIGQMVFFRSQKAPYEHGYAEKGQYNNDKTATQSKKLK